MEDGVRDSGGTGEKSFRALLRPELEGLAAYAPEPRKDILAKLDANEAPNIKSRELSEIVTRAISGVALERYPDPRASALKEAIFKRFGATPEALFIGSGSDEIISLLATALTRPRGRAPTAVVVAPTPSFVMYRVTSRAHGLKFVDVPLDAAWDLDVRTMSLAIETMQPNIVYIATPNNPTGNAMTEGRLEAIVKAAPSTLVVVDEAYAEYAGKSLRSLRASYSNVAILRTLSKVGLAALRVGYLEADEALVRELDKARQPFNVSETSQVAATAVLNDGFHHLESLVATVVRERSRVSKELEAMSGISVTTSSANFLWVKSEKPAEEIFSALLVRKVLVRSFHQSGGRLKFQLRVTIGTESENNLFLESMKAVLA